MTVGFIYSTAVRQVKQIKPEVRPLTKHNMALHRKLSQLVQEENFKIWKIIIKVKYTEIYGVYTKEKLILSISNKPLQWQQQQDASKREKTPQNLN